MKKEIFEKIGSLGSLFAAFACPGCFPLFAVVGSALGLSFLRPYEGWVFIVFQIFVGIALIGNVASFLAVYNQVCLKE